MTPGETAFIDHDFDYTVLSKEELLKLHNLLVGWIAANMDHAMSSQSMRFYQNNGKAKMLLNRQAEHIKDNWYWWECSLESPAGVIVEGMVISNGTQCKINSFTSNETSTKIHARPTKNGSDEYDPPTGTPYERN